jgi:hypothetical protein
MASPMGLKAPKVHIRNRHTTSNILYDRITKESQVNGRVASLRSVGRRPREKDDE